MTTSRVPRALIVAAMCAAWPSLAAAQAASDAPVLRDGWLARATVGAVSASSETSSPTLAAPDYHDYAHALGYSFTKGLFARDQIAPLAIGAGAALAFVPVDKTVAEHLRTDAPVLNRGGEIAGSPITLGALGGGLILGSLATDDARFRSYAFAFSQGLIVAESIATAVKLAVPRDRPDGTSRYSFPSAHAAGAFALAAVSAHYYGAKAGIPLYALAGVVALSRVTYGKHYPSDVIAGATIGYLAAAAAVAGTNHVTSHGSAAVAVTAQGFVFAVRF